MPVFEQIAPGKTGKGKGDEERARDGIKLPALRRNLPRVLFQGKTQSASEQIKTNELCQPERETLWRFEGQNSK